MFYTFLLGLVIGCIATGIACYPWQKNPQKADR